MGSSPSILTLNKKYNYDQLVAQDPGFFPYTQIYSNASESRLDAEEQAHGYAKKSKVAAETPVIADYDSIDSVTISYESRAPAGTSGSKVTLDLLKPTIMDQGDISQTRK